MMKNVKIANYLKTGILLVSVSLLLWNCEKEVINEVSNPHSVVEKIQQSFNKEDFTKSIPYEFDVNWDLVKKDYSEELKTDYYEFPISYTSSLTPHLNDLKKTKGSYFKSYKIIVTIKDESINFYALRIYEKILEKGAVISELSFKNSNNVTGYKHLIDKDNDIVFANKMEKGTRVIKDFYKKNLKELDPYKSKSDEINCVNVIVNHYTDWYKTWTDEDGFHMEYLSTRLTGTSIESICSYEYLPDYIDPNTIGGGSPNGSGSYKNGCSNTSPSSKTRYFSKEADNCGIEVTEDVVECGEGYIIDADGNCVEIGPSCESFNFVVTAPFWQESAVKSIRFNVYILDQNGLRYAYTQLYSTPILFGMPSDLSNGGAVSKGAAAEISADVLSYSIRATAHKFRGIFANETEIDLFFKNKLIENYRTYIPGGRVQFNSTTNLPATEYKTNFLGTGKCN